MQNYYLVIKKGKLRSSRCWT